MVNIVVTMSIINVKNEAVGKILCGLKLEYLKLKGYFTFKPI